MIIHSNIPANLIEFPEDAPARIARPKYITINEFDEYSACKFTDAFNQLMDEPQDKIFIHISSPGGAISSLMGMNDIIACSPKPVVTFTNSLSCSCGALLLALGTRGYRYASPNAMILVHEASTSSEGKTSDVLNEARYVEKLNDKLLEILAQHSNKSKDFYKKMIKKQNNADLFITPEDAKLMGIIDHVGVPKLTMNIKVTYDLENMLPKKLDRAPKSIEKVNKKNKS